MRFGWIREGLKLFRFQEYIAHVGKHSQCGDKKQEHRLDFFKKGNGFGEQPETGQSGKEQQQRHHIAAVKICLRYSSNKRGESHWRQLSRRLSSVSATAPRYELAIAERTASLPFSNKIVASEM